MTALSTGALAIVLGAAASGMTLLGGVLAFRLGNRLPLILGLTAGVVLGVAFFDLIPEAIQVGRGIYQPQTLFAALAAGLAAYMLIDRALAKGVAGSHFRPHLGPASLTAHSFIDGAGIGVAFQASHAAGVVIAIAVLAHDLADGINTVGLSLTGTRPLIARRWLLANSAAPLIGVLVGNYIHLGNSVLSPLLAGFGGAFLYIGACQLVPRSFAASRRSWTSFATIGGMALMYGAMRIAQL